LKIVFNVASFSTLLFGRTPSSEVSYAKAHGYDILGIVGDYAEVGCDPQYMGYAPFYASLILEALPPVTVPSSLKIVFNVASFSTLLFGRTPSSKAHGYDILGIVGDYAEVGCDPQYMGYAPFYAVEKLLDKTIVTMRFSI
jgi:acetyl-CoA acetyltransferase